MNDSSLRSRSAPDARPRPPSARRFWPWRSALLGAVLASLALVSIYWSLAARDALLSRVELRDPALADDVRHTFDTALGVLAAALVCGLAAIAFLVRRRLWAFRAEETDQYVIAIRREGAKWKALTESAADAIVIIDPRDGTVRERNRQAAALLGEAALSSVVQADDFAALEESMRAAVDDPGRAVAARELRVRAADGAERVVDVRMAGIDLVDERVVELSLRDVTRERTMERQLAVAERLSSLGLLTAGVAHEINNPLEGIGNYLSLLEKPGVGEEQRLRWVADVRHGFERIRVIVRDLLSFSRPGVEQGSAALSASLERVSKLVGYTKSFSAVEIVTAGVDAQMRVAAEQGRLEQVLLNLMMNAATAMGGRGRITVSAQRFERAGEPWIRIDVTDEGPGIASEHLSRLFDPFFTTTAGAGLGLSISYGLIRAHGGELRAANAPGGGAVFTVELPQAR